MPKLRLLAILVVLAHWFVAVWHLFPAADVVPPPNNHVSWVAIALMSVGHLAVSLLLWMLSDRFIGPLALMFFLAAMAADVYEHFVLTQPNNVFLVSGPETVIFDVSVFALLALEILGCTLGILSLSGWRHPRAAAP